MEEVTAVVARADQKQKRKLEKTILCFLIITQ